MRLAFALVLRIPCLLVGLLCAEAVASDGVLSTVPADADVIAVIHNMTELSQSIDDLAKLVQAPPPGLLNLAKTSSGLQQGIDDHGDLATVVTIGDSGPQGVLLVPVSDFAKFFAGLHVEEPTTGVVEVQLAGEPNLVGRKGDYAAIADTTDRDALERLLAATTNLSADASLGESLAANQVSVVVTSHGLKRLFPMLISGIRSMQANLSQLPGDQGKAAADAFNLYLQLFTAAEPELEQFSIALRIDSARNIEIIKHAQFKPEGSWAKWAASATPAEENLLAGLPAGPFVVAMGGVIPPGSMEHLMSYSVQVMQSQPMYQLTPEQAERYADLSMQAMSGIRSMQMLLGVPEPGAGLYSNSTAVMSFDDSQKFLTGYEKTLAAMRELTEETKSPLFPVTTVKHVNLGTEEALELTMDMSKMSELTPPGSPDPQQVMQAIMGPSGKLTAYLAAADEHAVVMCYSSLEDLKSAIGLYRSKQPGIMGDAGVAKVAAELPRGAQAVGFISVAGAANTARWFVEKVPGAPAKSIPSFPESPPLGMAVKVSPAGVDGRLVILADTLRAIGDALAATRGAAPPLP